MPEHRSPQFRILVVDDDPNLCSLSQIKLRKNGYSVELAADAAEALCQIFQFDPHIILLDINMPGLEGNELVSTIKSFKPDIEIFMITAVKDPRMKEECLRKGAVQYFEKPLDFKLLIDEVTQTLQNKKDAPAVRRPLSESEITEIEFVLKFLEKKGLMTREEVMEEFKRRQG